MISHKNDIIWYLFDLLSMIISRSIHVAANSIILFFFMIEWYPIMYMYHTFFIHPSVDGHLGCFHVWAIVNFASVNAGVHISIQIRVFIFSRYRLKSRIAAPNDSSILVL